MINRGMRPRSFPWHMPGQCRQEPLGAWRLCRRHAGAPVKGLGSLRGGSPRAAPAPQPSLLGPRFISQLRVFVPPHALKLPEEPITRWGEYWCDVTVSEQPFSTHLSVPFPAGRVPPHPVTLLGTSPTHTPPPHLLWGSHSSHTHHMSAPEKPGGACPPARGGRSGNTLFKKRKKSAKGEKNPQNQTHPRDLDRRDHLAHRHSSFVLPGPSGEWSWL